MESAEFDFILARANGPVLAYFSGTWPKAVQACKEMDTVVGEMARAYEGRLTCVKADISRCPEPTKRYGVTGAPAFVLIGSDGTATAETGPMDRTQFRDFLDGHL
ncbi:thioredoxin family protein (plasmid) [Streptomyces sp. CA-294286]|uniref:thioredoxin family protein n=1 Tax=Streptomyces sp. CA-294286 TaxID=3240070 RepID=UPI003D9380F1